MKMCLQLKECLCSETTYHTFAARYIRHNLTNMELSSNSHKGYLFYISSYFFKVLQSRQPDNIFYSLHLFNKIKKGKEFI